jgi:inner membrane transporter RhtA
MPKRPAPPGLSRFPAPAVVVASIVSTQIGATVAFRLFNAVGPGGAVLLRLGFAAGILAALWRPRLTGFSRHDYVMAFAFGLTLATMNFAFYEGLSRVPLGIAVTLEFVGPLGVAVAGSRNALDVLWVGLAATGILLLAPWGGLQLNLLGIGLVLVAGVMWAVYIILSGHVGRRFPGGTGLVLALIVSATLVLPVGVGLAGTALLNPSVLAAGIVVAILSSAITYSFELSALRRMPAHVFGVLMSLEPAVAAGVGLLFLGQSIGLRAGLAIACVVAASAGAANFAKPTTPPLID